MNKFKNIRTNLLYGVIDLGCYNVAPISLSSTLYTSILTGSIKGYVDELVCSNIEENLQRLHVIKRFDIYYE